jgi:hypothetical protein
MGGEGLEGGGGDVEVVGHARVVVASSIIVISDLVSFGIVGMWLWRGRLT